MGSPSMFDLSTLLSSESRWIAPAGVAGSLRTSDVPRRGFEPGARLLIHQRRLRLAYALMILVQPHRLRVDHILRFRHDDEVLDADAVFAGLVVARLVGADHPRLQRLGDRPLGDILRPLMHG